jgi:1-aminocyclopropane-1-carboxylate deaminase
MIDELLFSLHREQVSVDPVHLAAFADSEIDARVLRLDKIHSVISGNKWFKLKEYLNEIMEHQYKTVVTWGGAYSNHIVATAFACQKLNAASIGLIRGEQPAQMSHTLQEAARYGMQFDFIHRDHYAKKDAASLDDVRRKYPGAYFIPEGGAGLPGIKGVAEIMDWIKNGNYTDILCAMGTGTLFKGLCQNLKTGQRLTGIPVLKIAKEQRYEFNEQFRIHPEAHESMIFYDYHFGGYAKKQPGLISFMNSLFKETGIPTDFVYTGKLFYAGIDLASQKYFPPKSRLLFIHSGGLQGNLSLPPGTFAF